MSFPQINDESAEVFTRYEIPTQPAFVLVYPDGRTETLFGAASDAVLDMLIEGALA